MSSLFHHSAILSAALLALGFPIQVLKAGPGGALIYEDFDYFTGSMSGANGGIGFTSVWSTYNTARVVAFPGLSWGSLAVAGNSVTDSNGSSAAHDIGATSVLDDGSLMSNGATLWFSVVMKNAPGSIANVDFIFSLGTDAFLNFVTGSGGPLDCGGIWQAARESECPFSTSIRPRSESKVPIGRMMVILTPTPTASC